MVGLWVCKTARVTNVRKPRHKVTVAEEALSGAGGREEASEHQNRPPNTRPESWNLPSLFMDDFSICITPHSALRAQEIRDLKSRLFMPNCTNPGDCVGKTVVRFKRCFSVSY